MQIDELSAKYQSWVFPFYIFCFILYIFKQNTQLITDDSSSVMSHQQERGTIQERFVRFFYMYFVR